MTSPCRNRDSWRKRQKVVGIRDGFTKTFRVPAVALEWNSFAATLSARIWFRKQIKQINQRKLFLITALYQAGSFFFWAVEFIFLNRLFVMLVWKIWNLLAMFSIPDVIWWADNGVAIKSASSVETSFFRTTNSRSGTFVDIFSRQIIVFKESNFNWNYYFLKNYLDMFDCRLLNDSHRDIDKNNCPVRWHKVRCTNLLVLCTVHTRRHRDRI